MEGTVRVKAFSSAVLIRGRKAMNRAMQDDVVVIKILPKSQWLTPSTQLALDEEEGNDDDDDGSDGNDNNDGNDNDEETNTTNNNNNNSNKSGGSTNSGKGQSSKKSTEGDDEEGGEEGDSADSTSNQDIDAETLESAVAEEAATIDESVDASLELYTRKSKKDNNSNNTEQTTTTTGLDNDAESEKRPTGVVVGILKRTWKPCTGMLVSYPEFFSSVPMDTTNVSNNNKSDSSDNEKTATRMIFIPTDTRFPKVRVQTLRPSAFENQRVLITIDRWSKFSK